MVWYIIFLSSIPPYGYRYVYYTHQYNYIFFFTNEFSLFLFLLLLVVLLLLLNKRTQLSLSSVLYQHLILIISPCFTLHYRRICCIPFIHYSYKHSHHHRFRTYKRCWLHTIFFVQKFIRLLHTTQTSSASSYIFCTIHRCIHSE